MFIMNKIFAQRLKSARLMAGLSLQGLADKMDNLISKQAINKYEQGVMLPSSEILAKISSVMNLKVDYFFREKNIKLGNVEFRKRAKMGNKAQDAVKEKTVDFLERYLEIELLLNADLEFENPLKNIKIENQNDIESAAEQLRENWNLGANPIHNVMEMLEIRGVKIFEIDNNNVFDGLSAWVKDIPVIVLNRNVDNVRKRFTALHEFAHLILIFPPAADKKKTEKLCHGFAGALLLPKKELIRELGQNRKRISLQELRALKEYYGISMQAIMARAHALILFNEQRYKQFRIYMSKWDYIKNEPGEYKGLEETCRFKNLVYHAASEELITLNKAASLMNVRLADLQNNFQVI
jgi:Zn-dependent peptidase ImmA (M78 family)/DNA-binding XRE family transcriptional regulator